MRRIEEWYAVIDGDDIAPAWARMMAGAPAMDGGPPLRLPDPTRSPEQAGYDEWGARVAFGAGDYHFRSGGMEWTRRVLLAGEGVINTRLIFHVSGGPVFRARQSPGTSRPGQSASGSVMGDLSIIAQSPPVAGFDGVLIEAPVTLERVNVSGFARDGVRIDADVGRGTNANGTRLDSVRSTGHGRCGFYLTGGDANICRIIGCAAEHNGEHGFRDESFLGSTVVGSHASQNGDPANASTGDYLVTGDSQRGAWLGIYEETPKALQGDLRRSRIHPPNRWEGRVLVDALNTQTATAGIVMRAHGMEMADVVFKRPDGRVSMRLAPLDLDAAYEVRDLVDGDDWFRFTKRRSGGYGGSWVVTPKGGNANAPMTLRAGEMRAPASLIASPREVAGDLAAPRLLAVLPSVATKGAIVDVVDDGKCERWRGLDGPNGAYWSRVTWASPVPPPPTDNPEQ